MISRLVGLCLAVFYALNSQAQQTKPLIASGHPEYPPFMWLENDRIIGAGPEIANRIFAELAIEVDFSSVGSWQRVLHRAEHGKVDFIVGAFKTPHRETFLSYTQIPFIEDPVVIFVNKGQAFPFHKWQDLIDKEGVTGRGESFGEEFDRFEAESLNITRVADIGQAMAMLLRKRVDYVICGYYSGWTNILKSGWQDRFEKLPLAVNTPVAYQAFAKKSPYLKYLDYYNERLKALEASGEIKRIIEKNLQYWQQQSDLQQESRFP